METLIKLYSFYGGKHAYYNCRMRQVGSTLAEQLQEEDTDLTLIDTDADVSTISPKILMPWGLLEMSQHRYTYGSRRQNCWYHDCSHRFWWIKPALLSELHRKPDIVRPLPVYAIQFTVKRLVLFRNAWSFHDHQSGTGHCQRNLKTSAFSGSHQNRSIFKRTCRTSQV